MTETHDSETLDDELFFAPEKQPSLSKAPINKSILIVDDDEDMHLITNMVLKKASEHFKFELHHSYSGQQTIQLLDSGCHYDLILLDVVMEDDDSGFKMVRHLRHQLKDRHTKVIIRTGQAGIYKHDDMLKGIRLEGFYEKTELSSQKLITVISNALEKP